MKKLLPVLLLAAALTITGCSNNTKTDSTPSEAVETSAPDAEASSAADPEPEADQDNDTPQKEKTKADQDSKSDDKKEKTTDSKDKKTDKTQTTANPSGGDSASGQNENISTPDAADAPADGTQRKDNSKQPNRETEPVSDPDEYESERVSDPDPDVTPDDGVIELPIIPIT